MTKKELIDKVAENFGLTKSKADEIISVVIDSIHEGTAKDGVSASPERRAHAAIPVRAKP